MNARLRQVSGLLSALILAGCQTMPQKSASVPLALAGEEAAVVTELPPENPAAAAANAIASATGTGTSGAEVFARLQAGFRTPVCTDGDRSSLWRKRYAGNPRVFAQHLQQVLPMLDFVSREVQTSGLPTEFALIPLVESWYRPDAIGAGGPAGMWQMIGSTARNHGIRIQSGYDGRLSPVESTRAALSYLKTLHGMFGDWQATVMAYNAGEYRLINAFKRSGSRSVSGERQLPQGLSNITYDYVAKLQALSCLISQPQKQGLKLPWDARFQPLGPVMVEEKARSLDQIAKQRGIDDAWLRNLNPGYRSGRIVEGAPRLVLMPIRSELSTALAQAQPIASIGPVAIATSKPADTAGKNTAAGDAQSGEQAEPLTNETAAASAAPAVAIENAAVTAVAPIRTTPANHQVRSGDSLWSIARQYGLSLVALRRLNGLGKTAHLKPGQWLKLQP
jgi:membrane-bound lytic murein transglycosylase D